MGVGRHRRTGPTPLENVRIILKNPEAVPYILVALVVYFGFRHSVEWWQTAPERQRLLSSRFDRWVSHLIGLASLAVFSVQTSQKFQLVDKIGPQVNLTIVAAIAIMIWGFGITPFVKERLSATSFLVAGIGPLGLVLAAGGSWNGTFAPRGVAVQVVAGLFVAVTFWGFRRGLRALQAYSVKEFEEMRRQRSEVVLEAAHRIDEARIAKEAAFLANRTGGAKRPAKDDE